MGWCSVVIWQVRWADIEERKDQMRRRELGFVIGQTDWAKMTDDTYADRALNRTKYIWYITIDVMVRSVLSVAVL